jgi:hypothetical protein
MVNTLILNVKAYGNGPLPTEGREPFAPFAIEVNARV